MNDIERQIEDSFNDNVDGSDNENMGFNHRGSDKKKLFLYIGLGLIVVVIVCLIVYLMINKRDNDKMEDSDVKEEVTNKEDSVIDNIGYVSCDDNTSLLNVRNSTTLDIIDGLSCYHVVTIEEEAGKTDNCDKWYKVSYKKRDNSYTGYVCSKYIKMIDVSSSIYNSVKEVIGKAIDYYDNSNIMPYCGVSFSSKKVKFKEGNGNFEGEYLESEFKDLDELRDYLLGFMDSSLISDDLVISDYNNPKMYDDYYMIDGKLYCRGYTGKGYRKLYTGNYDFEIVSVTDSRIDVNIAYEYITENTSLKEGNECTVDNLSKCSNADFEYKIGKIVINIKNNNYIISKMDFPE